MRTGLNQIPVARYKLSPNEEAQLLKKEREKKKKQRLIAVRLQSKQFSQKVLNDVRREKEKQLQLLAKEIEKSWLEEKQEKLDKLEDLYERNLKHVGGAHVAAVDQDIEGIQELRELVVQENQRVTGERGQKAIQKQLADDQERLRKQTWHIRARQDALEKEKIRAADVASRPPIPVNPVDEMELPNMKPIKFTDHDAFSQTHYHIPNEYGIVKEDKENQPDAREVGELEGERYDELEFERKRVENERKEKARLRHITALEKERLDLDYGNILHELSDLQKNDRIRRQKIVSTLPKQLFVPPLQRLEQLEDDQRDMERAFEDCFLKDAAVSAAVKELILDTQPEPPTPSDELSLSTVEEPTHNDNTDKESSQEDSTVRRLLDTTKQPDGGLKTLLSRIKSQRDTWVKKTNVESPRTLTQYTGSEVSTLETGEAEFSSPGGEADSKSTVSTKTQSDELSTADEGTITSSGTITDGRTNTVNSEESQTLLHPLEKADKIRQTNIARNSVNQYLSIERQKQQQIALENQQIKEEAQIRRAQLEKQKQDLENRLRQIEMKRRELQGGPQSQNFSATAPQIISREALPSTFSSVPATQPFNSGFSSERREPFQQPDMMREPFQQQNIRREPFQQPGLSTYPNMHYPGMQGTTQNQTTDPSANQSQLSASSSAGISGYSYNIDRVREYQEKLLKRQGDQKDQMRLAHEDLQKRVDEMLNKAKDDYHAVPTQNGGLQSLPLDGTARLSNFPNVSPLQKVSPLGYFQDISPLYDEQVISRDGSLIPPMQRLSLDSVQNTSSGYNPHEQVQTGSFSGQPDFNDPSIYRHPNLGATQPGFPVRTGSQQDVNDPGSLYNHLKMAVATSSNQISDSSSSYGPAIPVMVEQPLPRSTGGGVGSYGAPSLSARSDPSVSSYHSLGMLVGNQRPVIGTLPQSEDANKPSPYTDSQYTAPGMYEDEFSVSLAQKKNQLKDIQKRKEEILERQRQHEEELQTLRERYEVDFLSSGSDSNHGFNSLQPETTDINNRFHSLQPENTTLNRNQVEMAKYSYSLPNQSAVGQAAMNFAELSLPAQPMSGWTYESTQPLKPELSTIIEVDSPEKTLITTTRLTEVGEANESTDLSQGAITATQSIGETSTSVLKSPRTAESSGFIALDSQLDDSSFQPLQSGIEITGSSHIHLDLTGSSNQSGAPSTQSGHKSSRNWHEVLADSSQSSGFSSAPLRPSAEQVRGIPVGKSEPVSSRYSQFRQEAVGEEQARPLMYSNQSGPVTSGQFSSISQSGPVSSGQFASFSQSGPVSSAQFMSSSQSVPVTSAQFMSLKEDAESTMVSSIADDLPKDRDEFLELREGSPSPEGFQSSGLTRITRPLSSTPARAGQPTPVNIDQLRRPQVMHDEDQIITNGTQNINGINFTGATPSAILGVTPSTILGSTRSTVVGFTPSTLASTQQTPSTLQQLTLKTPSTGNATDLTQYTLHSGSSSDDNANARRSAMLTSDLTQYPFSADELSQHQISGDRSTRLSHGSMLGMPRVALSYNDSQSINGEHRMSSHLSDLSQYPDPSMMSQTGKGLLSGHDGFVSGSEPGSSRMCSDDPKATVVRFAPGDPDVRFMSASSSEQGGSQANQVGYQPNTFPFTSQPYTAPLSTPSLMNNNFQNLPYTIGNSITPQLSGLNPPSYQMATVPMTSSVNLSHHKDRLSGVTMQPLRPDTIGANVEEMSALSQFSAPTNSLSQFSASLVDTPPSQYSVQGNSLSQFHGSVDSQLQFQAPLGESLLQFHAPLGNLSQRIEETMKKHEKLLEESRKMSEKHEEEKAKYKFDELSLETLDFKEQETGITDEPDLTLVSGDDKQSVADISSLLSFEQHEKSQGTLSDHNDKSLRSNDSHSILDGATSSNIYKPTSLFEDGSSPLWLPLESDATQASTTALSFTQPSTALSSSTTPVPTDPLSGSSASTPTPTGAGSPGRWERDLGGAMDFRRPAVEDESSEESQSRAHFISIPVCRIEDDSANDSVEGLSLQEVFAKKKAGFIEKSNKRKEASQSKLAQPTGQPRGSVGQPSGSTGHMSKTMSNWKKSRGIGKPSGIPQASPSSLSTKTAADRKKAEDEMKQRTNRLYNRLEDVKEKKHEEKRKQEYIANREKAKEYNRKLQETRLKKKAGVKKT